MSDLWRCSTDMILPFPSSPFINPNHPANINLRFSWSAIGVLAAYELASTRAGIKNGAPTVAFDPILGTCLQFITASDYFSFSGQSRLNDQVMTVGILVNVLSLGADVCWADNDTSGAGGWRVRTIGAAVTLTSNNVANYGTQFLMSAGIPYLIILSANPAVGVASVYQRNLLTGQINSTIDVGTFSASPAAAPNGTFTLGAGAGPAGDSKIAAVLYSAQYMPYAVMRQWGADPFGPWRNPLTQRVFSTLVGSTAVVTGTTPWPFFNMRAA